MSAEQSIIAPAIDIHHLRGWIGRTEEARDIITPRLAGEFSATFAPHLAPANEADAPMMLQWCLAPPLAPAADLTIDGHMKKGGFLPPVPLPRRMWAGGAVETFGALRIGDDVRRVSRIDDVSLKEGRTGRLCFVTVRHEFFARDALMLAERHDIVYRDAGSQNKGAGMPDAKGVSPQADLAWTVDAGATMLFRYSALMFNAHRIHYDFVYATEVEGYSGLVVHGPLQASLLFNIAATLAGKPPKIFDYRGLSPLIGPAQFQVLAMRDGDAIRAWTQNSEGARCMECDARF